MPVNSVHPQLKASLPLYEIIRDCLAGEAQVKSRKDKYLPRPNKEDTSNENLLRYEAYLTRAVFYNVCKRTLGGLIGQIFAREPIIDVPTLLDPVIHDANGMGVNLVQLAKQTCNFVIAFGRAGVFIDYPMTEEPASRADIEAGNIRPTITIYDPAKVLNWRTIKRGGRHILSLVVLEETYIKSDDGFEAKDGKQWRVLRLDNAGQYTIEIWNDKNTRAPQSTLMPVDADGKRLDEIPFAFVGVDNNDTDVDPAPLYDLASLNIAHYRNSADYEESSYVTGQPTPYFTGLTENWVKEILQGKVQLGARAAVPLPVGATAGMLQCEANILPKDAMDQKEAQMVALGAKLIEAKAVMRTATEVNIDYSHETSTLSAAADNVSDVFGFALKWCSVFVGVQAIVVAKESEETPDGDVIKFVLNTEFDLLKLSSEDRRALIDEWTANVISFTEMRTNLRRGGIAFQDDEAAKEEIDAERETRQQEALTNAKAMSEATGKPEPAKKPAAAAA